MPADGRNGEARGRDRDRRATRGDRRGRGPSTRDGRVRLLQAVFVIAFLAIGGKAIALTSTQSNLARVAEQQQLRTVQIPAPRGGIYDRDGQPLAKGVEARTVFATPYMLDDPRTAALQLAKALKIRWRPLYRELRDKKSGFAFVARQASPDLAAKALALGLPGVGDYVEEKRDYPMKTVAAQLIGFAGVDNRGLAGLEAQYDDQLAGKAGKQVVVQAPGGLALKTVSSVDPVSGQDLRLTIDQSIQFTAEQVLADTVRRTYAKSGTAIVLDPRTGEIYALANAPLVDAQAFGDSLLADQRNHALVDSYEPGSTFKTITVAGALSEGLVKPTTKFVIPPSLAVGDRIITDAEKHGTETLTVKEILAYSSNIGAVKIGEQLGKARLLKWTRAFGFGRTTGSGFPGETPGFVLPGDQWSVSTIGNVPMGQGISVTAMQMAAAYAAVANDGVLVQPHVVARVGTQAVGPMPQRRVISARVARQLRDMLSAVVGDAMGTGTKARIPGYTVAGKTGTAQKVINGVYSHSQFVASFIGMVPAQNPQLVVLVVVDQPHPIWGGVVAAPAFARISSFALQRLGIAP